ncbi:MAG: hypothetical protein R2932_22800 [Caldilineaceae bacterium]
MLLVAIRSRWGTAIDQHLARRGLENTGQHLDCRRLARLLLGPM